MHILAALALLACAASVAHATPLPPLPTALTPTSDPASGWVRRVDTLPGLSNASATQFAAETFMFTGMVDVQLTKAANNTHMWMHYMVAADTALFASGAAADDCDIPVVVWWNGGPGAPSTWGLFVENGPWLLNDESLTTEEYARTGVPSPVRNYLAWTSRAVVIVMDNPPPCGYSYCDPPGPGGDAATCGAWNDTRVGLTDAEAVRLILEEHFPNLLSCNPSVPGFAPASLVSLRPLLFIGESYAGVYISITAHYIISEPRFAGIRANLRGTALGDACMGYDQICGRVHGPYWDLFFMFGHGQLSVELWQELLAHCDVDTLKNVPVQNWTDAKCLAVYNYVNNATGPNSFYTYNLFDTCPDNEFAPNPLGAAATARRTHFNHRPPAALTPAPAAASQLQHTHDTTTGEMSSHRLRVVPSGPGATGARQHRRAAVGQQQQRAPAAEGKAPATNGYWCMGQVLQQWISRSSVKAALGVSSASTYFLSDDGAGMPYTYNLADGFALAWTPLFTAPEHADLARRFVLWGYNGDADPALNIFRVQERWSAFAAGNNFAKSSEWHPWALESIGGGIAGGYAVEWRGGSVQFVTARGSGHMVPEYAPRIAHGLLGRFIETVLRH